MNKEILDAFWNSQDRDEWAGFHDVVMDALGPPYKSFTKEDLRPFFYNLTDLAQGTAFSWGLSDSVFKDQACVEIRKAIA